MNNKENIILVPIDATDQTLVALNQSYNLARLTKSKLILMSVDEGKTDVQKRLNELALEAEMRSGVPVQTILRTGNVYQEITHVASEIEPLFILMGVTSKKSKNRIIGKNAFRMMRESKYPVIAIRGKQHRNGCKTIVLPLDLTKETREKIAKGVELAKMFDAHIHVISVLTAKDELSEHKLLAYSAQVTSFIENRGVSVTLKTIASDDITQSILTYSREVEADLIVVMSQSELNFVEYFIGTTAEKLISESEIPVLTLRPKVKKDLSVFIPY
jgi:nucleotide-binding universal stress UspA family protein